MIVEPFIWKAFCLNKMKKYEQSNKILENLVNKNKVFIKDNDKKNLIIAEKNILKSIDIFDKIGLEKTSICYSWL